MFKTNCFFLIGLYFIHSMFISQERDDPVLLTPLIESNKLHEAKNAAKVNYSAWKNITSYAGLITVDISYNSNIFFWFVLSKHNYRTDPVLLYLQGGPGVSGMFGLFNLNGPFMLDTNMKLIPREYSWTNKFSIIYVDNPVGTGFSSTKGGYAQNQTIIGDHLYSFVTQFFTLFPELQQNDFYIVGESYGSKYGAALGRKIHKKNPNANVKINLKGFIIESGTFDPEITVKKSEYLYKLGLVDEKAKITFETKENKVFKEIKSENYKKAFDVFNPIMRGYFGVSTLFKNYTGLGIYSNILTPVYYENKVKYAFESYIKTSDVRNALHVGNTKYGDSDTIVQNLLEDILKTTTPWLETLLNNYKIIFYNGQLDVYAAYTTTAEVLDNLKFNTSKEYKNAERQIWYVEDQVAGYIKSGGNLAGVLVRNAGHLVSLDQSKNVYDLINKFIDRDYI